MVTRDLTTGIKPESSKRGFALVITSHALNHTYDSLYPILYPSMISELDLSYGLIGVLAMGYRLFSGALQLVMGFLGRFVRRKILLGLGMIWQCTANSTAAFGQGFEHIFISRSLAGVGSSPQHPTSAAYIAETFSKERIGRALGINIAAAMMGSFLAPFLGTLVLTTVGWRNTILAFSVPGFLLGIAFLFMRESKRSQKWSGGSTFSYMYMGLREVLTNRTVVAVMILEAVMAFRIGARDFLPSFFVHDLAMTSLESGIVFTVFVAVGIPAPYFWGYLSDRLDRRKVVVLSMSFAAALWFALSYARNMAQLLAVLLPNGFVGQGIGGVVQAFVAESTTKENRDLIYGIYFTLSFTLGSLSAVILGYLADGFGFQACFIWVAIVSFLTVVAAAILLRQRS